MIEQPQTQLTELLADICSIKSSWDRPITGLCLDSRQIKPGDLFFAYPGTQTDGREFIDAAIHKGAVAILAEANEASPKAELCNGNTQHVVPIIYLENVAHYIGLIADKFYGHPTKHMPVVGITGTNGKSSCSHFIAACLQMAGKPCGIVGTLGSGLYGHLQQSNLTTPDPITLQHLFAEFKAQAVQYVSMEVSSHSLVQDRVTGINFDIGVFTNLTQDHLDYHGNMTEYANAKRLLFSQPGMRYVILNGDDPYGKQWAQELNDHLKVITYSIHNGNHNGHETSQIYAYHTEFGEVGIAASVRTPWGDGVFNNPYLIGHFNLSNLLAVLGVLGALNIPLQDALSYIARLRGVPGRMETFGGNGQPVVVVDFSHTPDSLEQVLQTLKSHCKNKLWCVFGCGGNRDKTKRPLMGRIAEQYADHVIVTNDNPRKEDPRQIVADIVQGMVNPTDAVIEYDRQRAIEHAIHCAQEGDVVLIAGKGHENYQIVGEEKLPFSDSIEVQLILARN